MKKANNGGSITKRTDVKNGKSYESWRCRYSLPDGTRHEKKFPTQAEAQAFLTKVLADLQNGDYVEPSKMTVAQWADIWITEYSAGWKFATKTKYENIVRTHIKPGLGRYRLHDLTGPHVQRFYNELGKTGKVTRKKNEKGQIEERKEPLSPKSIRLIHGVLSKAMNTAVRVGYIKRNPATLCTIPKLEKKEISPLTDDEIRDFLSLCESESYGRIYKLILFTGLREGEALGLTWDCIDFRTGAVKICKQLQHQGNKDVLVTPKSSKPRFLTVPPFVLQILKEEKTHQLEQRLAAGESWQGWQTQAEMKTSLVFVRDDGKNITAAALYQRYKHLAEKIGAPESRVHDLRHTYAVLSLQNGDPIKTVQDNLGHATAAFTLDVYGHTTDRMKQDSAARMQKYFEEIG